MSSRGPMIAGTLLILGFLVGAPARGHEEATPESVVDAFHEALAAGDRDAALSHLASEVIIFEGGGAEMSRGEYANHHLPGDMKFSAALETEITHRETRVEGTMAWLMSRSRTRGAYEGRDLDLLGTETMLLRRSGTEWKIVHVHWSSRTKE